MLYEADEFFLVTPEEKVRIQVEDCPFIVEKMEIEGTGSAQNILLTTNTEENIVVDQDHLIKIDNLMGNNEPHPIINVRNGLNALINRAVYYRLVEAGIERSFRDYSEIGVWSSGRYFSLGRLD